MIDIQGDGRDDLAMAVHGCVCDFDYDYKLFKQVEARLLIAAALLSRRRCCWPENSRPTTALPSTTSASSHMSHQLAQQFDHANPVYPMFPSGKFIREGDIVIMQLVRLLGLFPDSRTSHYSFLVLWTRLIQFKASDASQVTFFPYHVFFFFVLFLFFSFHFISPCRRVKILYPSLSRLANRRKIDSDATFIPSSLASRTEARYAGVAYLPSRHIVASI